MVGIFVGREYLVRGLSKLRRERKNAVEWQKRGGQCRSRCFLAIACRTFRAWGVAQVLAAPMIRQETSGVGESRDAVRDSSLNRRHGEGKNKWAYETGVPCLRAWAP